MNKFLYKSLQILQIVLKASWIVFHVHFLEVRKNLKILSFGNMKYVKILTCTFGILPLFQKPHQIFKSINKSVNAQLDIIGGKLVGL